MSLQITNINKTFSQGEHTISVLENINFSVKQGELVAILGESGSGKTTLLSLMGGLERPDSGRISINNSEITNMTEKEMTRFRAENIGIVFQQFHLLSHLTAIENVSLPLEIRNLNNSVEDARVALQEVGLAHRLDHLPEQLSGGEKQRVAIARALVTKPKLLLADEPSGNLDAKTGEQVMNYFFSIVKKYNMTSLLVTHNESLTKHCDRIIKIANGKLIEL